MSFRKGSYCGAMLTIGDLKDRCYIDDITGCWIWRGARDASGAPSVFSREIGGATSVGVLICMFKTGKRPEKGRRWFSTCETGGCANPKHRKEGSVSESLMGRTGPRTKVARDKMAVARRQRGAKLTAQIAADIRESEESSRAIARQYGIAQSTASRIKTGEIWRPIGGSSVFTWRGVA